MNEITAFLRKVANDIGDDYSDLGAHIDIVKEYKAYVNKLTDDEIEFGFKSFKKTPGRFLFGRIPLQYYLMDERLKEKYKHLFSSYDVLDEKVVDTGMSVSNPVEMLGLGGEIAALTKEVLAEIPTPSQMGPKLDIGNLIETVRKKVEHKLESGKFDQDKLQEQAKSMVENFGGPDATSRLLSSQLSQLVSMTNQMNMMNEQQPKKNKKKKKH
jgi:hypothetical protein